jgi:hypothetical protein
MARTIHPLDIDARLVIDVGMLTIQWARVEFTLKKILIGILKAEAPVGLLLTGDLGFKAIQNFTDCYLEANPSAILATELSQLMKEAARLYSIRNSFVHNTWHPEASADKHHLLVVRFRGRVQLYSEVWSDQQRANAIEETIALLTGLSSFGQKHGLFIAFDEWERQASSPETLAPRRLANPRARSPTTEELLRQLQP